MKTMKIILLIYLIAFPIICFSQSTKDLDLKNGFRNFKLGSSPDQIKNIKKSDFQFSKNPNVTKFTNIGKDNIYIFNVKIENVDLSFFRNKLFSIRVIFDDMTADNNFELSEFNSVLTALEKTYGNIWSSVENEDGVFLNGAIWEGDKVVLELLRIDYRKKYNNIGGYMHIYDKKLIKEMYSSDF